MVEWERARSRIVVFVPDLDPEGGGHFSELLECLSRTR